ncbi:hypothetical protein PR001_g25992 [Phytophthora rubi]|uniref:Peroxisomal membrane protein PEX16 n=1 Tax=Phytophthora rubi TaxID=129364 RepID=A0A6A3HXJ5_9STRA|nr:hypothetical protein PR001_g25992 [Phytophthora rubi]
MERWHHVKSRTAAARRRRPLRFRADDSLHTRGWRMGRRLRVHRLDALQDLAILGAYEAWVGSHSGLAPNVETTLYVAPQLVPKRVMEPEVATQFGYSLVGLLHLYH